ncbi:MAG: DUF192 domain-containing protein [Treponema sp.]|nr:DUF192 domain-containing protein [Treponema sp.]
MKRLFCIAVLCSVAVLLFGAKKLEVRPLTICTADGTEIHLRAEMARTGAEQQRGLMGRKSVPDGTGMLFVFTTDQILHFWMKDTPHPLSIAYIDRKGIIRDIFDMNPYSLATVSSTFSARYALEVPQGWFARAGIKAGDRLVLDF